TRIKPGRAAVAEDEVTGIAVVTQKIVCQVAHLYPTTKIETHSDGVFPLYHREGVGEVPHWNVAGGKVVDLASHDSVPRIHVDLRVRRVARVLTQVRVTSGNP